MRLAQSYITLIFGAILVGTVVGWLTAKRVQMTKMPELVSLFNGMGGACAGLIGLIEFPESRSTSSGKVRHCVGWNDYRISIL